MDHIVVSMKTIGVRYFTDFKLCLRPFGDIQRTWSRNIEDILIPIKPIMQHVILSVWSFFFGLLYYAYNKNRRLANISTNVERRRLF